MESNAIRDMFKDILTTEKTVLLLYEKIVKETANENVKQILKSIIKDEARHVKNAREALTILDSP